MSKKLPSGKNNYLTSNLASYSLVSTGKYSQNYELDDIARILYFVVTELKSNIHDFYKSNLELTKQNHFGPIKNNNNLLKSKQISDIEKLINMIENLDYNQIFQDLETQRLSKDSIKLLNSKEKILNYIDQENYELFHFSQAQKNIVEEILEKLSMIAKN